MADDSWRMKTRLGVFESLRKGEGVITCHDTRCHHEVFEYGRSLVDAHSPLNIFD